MSKKLINTLKYGSGKTKRKIYLMFGILAAGAVLTVIALVFGNALMGLAAFLVIFIDLMIYILPIFIIEDEIKKNFKDLEPEEYSKFSKILILELTVISKL